MIVKGLNDASREPVLHPQRGAGEWVRDPKSGQTQWKYKTSLTPAKVNCALCACAALCSHIFQERYKSGRVLRVMWHEIINKQQSRELSLSALEQGKQQHQLSFQYFLDAIISGTEKKDPWSLIQEPRAGDIEKVNQSQCVGMERFITEVSKTQKPQLKVYKINKYKKTKFTLQNAIRHMKRKGPNWIFAVLVIGEASFTAEAGSKTEFFGHWNFAYLTRDKEARFVDYQGEEAVRSEWPVCAAAGDLLAEPGQQETLLIAVHSEPWWPLIPKTIFRASIKASEPKQKNPLRPHAMSTTRAATTPADGAAVFPAPPSAANNRRQPTPRRTTRPPNASRKRSRSRKK